MVFWFHPLADDVQFGVQDALPWEVIVELILIWSYSYVSPPSYLQILTVMIQYGCVFISYRPVKV